MNPIHNNNLFLYLPFEVKDKICYHLFFGFNRDDVISLLKTCKSFLQLKGQILQQWPYYLRERTIQNIRSRSLPPESLKIVDNYEQEASLYPYSGTVFLYNWLNQIYLNNNWEKFINEIELLTNNVFYSPKLFFKGNETELAYVYTAISNDKNLISFIINKYQAQGAFDHILKFTFGNESLQGILLHSFIEYGFKNKSNYLLVRPSEPLSSSSSDCQETKCDSNPNELDTKSSSLSPFMKVLLNANIKLPFKSVSALITYLIIPLFNDKVDNQKYINKLFQLIPENYSFSNDTIKDGCINMILSIYINKITPISPSSFDRKMTLQEEEKFIHAIEELPHPVLKSIIIDSLLDLFYLQEPNMHKFWSCLHRIEKRFRIQQQNPSGYKFFDRSTETFVNQLIKENYQNFIALLEDPRKSYFGFLIAIANLFSNRPDWLTTMMSLDDDINDLLHQNIISLLIRYKKFDKVRALLEKINDPSIKEILKNNLDQSLQKIFS